MSKTTIPRGGLGGGLPSSLTVGSAAAEDTKVVFDGNAQDYHIGLDDSADDLVIGLGSSLGTTAHIVTDEAGHVTMPLQSTFSAHRNGTDQSTSGGTDVSWTHERWDKNSDMGSTSFTAPVTGTYLLIAQAKYAVTNGDGVHGIEIHTSNQNWYSTINSMAGNTDADIDHYSRQFSVLADMDASDTAKMHVNISNRDLNGNVSYTWFSGALIC